ncbi:MAG: biopolymer transporter ExbD, partial [Planctomycetes bacterium]|nr:biopolymer transporter ExbD [Planctomycetota bacterium]
SILIDNEAVDISHIKQRLSKIVKADNKKNLIIEADADVPHGLVVSVMDAGNVAGFEKLLVASEKANKSKNGK